jgi:hypothetical protein
MLVTSAVILIGGLIILWPSGFVISKITKRWTNHLEKISDDSLPEAGKWIGYLERILVYTLVLLGQYEAIGLLLTAKSILRFGSKIKVQSEYILVGTLLSISIALLVGLAAKLIISYN